MDDKLSKLLLRMESCADISFLVGTNAVPIPANKTTLATHSDVFAKLFFGEVAAPTQVRVPDIEFEIFQEMITFIYTKFVNLTSTNTEKLLYASVKYMIYDLKEKCERFIADGINPANCLEVYSKYQNYDTTIIDKKCFDFLLKNPVNHFDDPAFLEFGASALRRFIQQPAMNCNQVNLENVTLKWMKKNCDDSLLAWTEESYKQLEKVTGIMKNQMVAKRPFSLDLNWLGQLTTGEFSNLSMIVRTDDILLYGVGVYVGLPKTDEHKRFYAPAYFNETINVKVEAVSINVTNVYHRGSLSPIVPKLTTINSVMATQQISQSISSEIMNIMIKPLILSKWIRITVDFGESKIRTVTTQNVCSSETHNHELAPCRVWKENGTGKSSCVAYLLYDIKK